MSETGFRIFNSAFSAGAEVTYAILLTAFFRPFVPSQGRKWRKLLIVFSAYILFELVFNRAALPQGSFGLILAVMLLVASKWIGLKKSFVFLLTLLYFNARISSGLMVQSLYFIVERSLPLRIELPEAAFLRSALLVTLFLLSHAALLAVMLYALQYQMSKKQMTLHWREVCYISLVPTAGIESFQHRDWLRLQRRLFLQSPRPKSGTVEQFYKVEKAVRILSNTIQPSYGATTYSPLTTARETKQTGTQGSNFLDLAAQASGRRTDTLTTAMSGITGMAALPTSLMMDLSVRSAGQVQAAGVESVEAPSLETMLKAKYPNLVYHVFDASSGYWRTRNDYPHYLLYQEGDKAKETLENWQPTGANPFYGSVDGQFIAPSEIKAR